MKKKTYGNLMGNFKNFSKKLYNYNRNLIENEK